MIEDFGLGELDWTVGLNWYVGALTNSTKTKQ